MRLAAGRLLLAAGLVVSAGLVATGGGWSGRLLGITQAGVAVAIVLRRASPWPSAWAVLALIPGPLMAARHWTAQLPGACHCARLPHAPPGLVSQTGAAVVIDLALLGLALWLVAAGQPGKVENSWRQ